VKDEKKDTYGRFRGQTVQGFNAEWDFFYHLLYCDTLKGEEDDTERFSINRRRGF
jgi:hypothetical protein